MEVKLVMFKPDGQRKDVPVNSSNAVIGRGEDCTFRIPLGPVSRRHCELSIQDGEVRVKDLASSNGTYVNNKKVNEASLNAGDRLVIGPVTFTVQIDGKPEEIAPTSETKTEPSRPEAPAKSSAESDDEVVELEEDIFSELNKDDDEDQEDAFAAMQSEKTNTGAEEMDPIAALEALASEKDEDDESDENDEKE